MKTAYTKSALSPYQIDIRDTRHPVKIEIQKSLNTHNLTATFEENKDELEMLKEIPGVISIKCVLRLDGKVIATGFGLAILNRVNKYVERTVRSAVNSSLISAIYQGVKVLDALHFDSDYRQTASSTSSEVIHTDSATQGITDKQKGFIRMLVSKNVKSEFERNRWESEIDNLTRDQASSAIKALQNK